MQNQLFILDRKLTDAISKEAMTDTYEDMQKLKINKPPYSNFSIQGDAGLFWGGDAEGHIFRFDHVGALLLADGKILSNTTCWIDDDGTGFTEITIENEEQHESMRDISNMYLSYLIVALATRNVEKNIQKRHAKIIPGQARNWAYTTSLRIGKITINENGSEYLGGTCRPHLRRGHIREQAYGPRFQYHRKIWVEPVFVNGCTSEEAEKRLAYNVGVAA